MEQENSSLTKSTYYSRNRDRIIQQRKTKRQIDSQDPIVAEKRREYMRAYWAKNREKQRRMSREKYQRTKNTSVREYTLRNKERIEEYQRLYRLEHKLERKQYVDNLLKEKPGYFSYYAIRQEKNRQLRRPKWVNTEELKLAYHNVPEGMVIDHIIPLLGKNVSGLDVPWNIQYLSFSENNYKRNKFDFTYDNNSWRTKYNLIKQV